MCKLLQKEVGQALNAGRASLGLRSAWVRAIEVVLQSHCSFLFKISFWNLH